MSLVAIWYQPKLAWFLYPFLLLELLYRCIICLRRKFTKAQKIAVPVIVVGNITLGGTGKTPLILWLIEYLQKKGLKVGVISRGYKAKPPYLPYLVKAQDLPLIAGDEPLLIAKTGVPIVISPNRVQAAQFLLSQTKFDLIISDDGLQHYALERDLELVLIDAERSLGNGHCLPCGPLREPKARLNQVHAVIYNGAAQNSHQFTMQLEPQFFINLKTRQQVPLNYFGANAQIHAVAGIGNPERFFASLESLNLRPIFHPLPDHANFSANDFNFNDELPIIMTAKDAVKCYKFAHPKMWYLQVKTKPCAKFIAWFEAKLQEYINELKS